MRTIESEKPKVIYICRINVMSKRKASKKQAKKLSVSKLLVIDS
nr:MAG TPA: hypothetical protein [Caudoviricetes sp.]